MTDDSSHIGLDVGGAHLKMARVDAAGRVQAAAQWSTPLWQGLDVLDCAVDAIHGDLKTHEAGRIAVTMTGELVDHFRDRNQGVVDISRWLENCFGRESVRYYAGSRGFLESESCQDHVNEIASANWHGTTRYVAGMIAQGILFDLGSTTADIIPFGGGNVLARATTDHERLRTHELCYTGVVRTPVMAMVDQLPWGAGGCPVMREQFAVMADVYRITGELPENADMYPACDGREKTVEGSVRRLARMIGLDRSIQVDQANWHNIAVFIRDAQLRMLRACLQSVLDDAQWPVSGDRKSITVVGAGCGRFLIRRLANELQLPYVDFESLLDVDGVNKSTAADCAAAVAVAQLLRMGA